jgi:hypothetical protein
MTSEPLIERGTGVIRASQLTTTHTFGLLWCHTPILGASEGFTLPDQIFRFPEDFTILMLSNGARIQMFTTDKDKI